MEDIETMAANGGAPGNLMDLMDHTPMQSGKKVEKSSKKGASSSGLPVDGVPPQASKAQAAPADAKKKKKVGTNCLCEFLEVFFLTARFR